MIKLIKRERKVNMTKDLLKLIVVILAIVIITSIVIYFTNQKGYGSSFYDDYDNYVASQEYENLSYISKDTTRADLSYNSLISLSTEIDLQYSLFTCLNKELIYWVSLSKYLDDVKSSYYNNYKTELSAIKDIFSGNDGVAKLSEDFYNFVNSSTTYIVSNSNSVANFNAYVKKLGISLIKLNNQSLNLLNCIKAVVINNIYDGKIPYTVQTSLLNLQTLQAEQIIKTYSVTSGETSSANISALASYLTSITEVYDYLISSGTSYSYENSKEFIDAISILTQEQISEYLASFSKETYLYNVSDLALLNELTVIYNYISENGGA